MEAIEKNQISDTDDEKGMEVKQNFASMDETDCEKLNDLFIKCDDRDQFQLIMNELKLAVERNSERDLDSLLKEMMETKNFQKYFKHQSASLMHDAIMNDAGDVIPHLIQAGAQTCDLNSDGDTDIHLAIRYQKHDALRGMLKFKQNINSINRLGQFPLFLATELDMVDAVKLLLKSCVNVNTKLGSSVQMLNPKYIERDKVSISGDTIPHLLVRRIAFCEIHSFFHGDECNISSVVQMLDMILDAGFTKSAANSYGYTLFDEVIIYEIRSCPIVYKLKRDEFPINLENPLHHACALDTELCMLVLEALKKQHSAANLIKMMNPTFDAGFEPLSVASGQLNPDAVKWLLENGADPNCSTLANLMSGGHEQFLCYPLRHSAAGSVNLSPMHIACNLVRPSSKSLTDLSYTLKLLITHGAKVNAKASDDATPLSWLCYSLTEVACHSPTFENQAFMSQFASVFLLLLQAGANPDLCSVRKASTMQLMLEKFTSSKLRNIVMILLEMSTNMAGEAGLTVEDVTERLSHLSDFVPEGVLDRCLRHPRSLKVLSRKIILENCGGRHLDDTVNSLHMLPARLRDYVCLKHLLDPQWYLDLA